MTDNEEPLDFGAIKAASDAEFELLAEAMTEFSAALDEWDENGRRLTLATLDRVQSLSGSVNDTLRVLAVTVLVDELARLPEPRVPLVPGANSMFLALQEALWDLAVQISQMMSRLIAQGGALNDLGDAFVALRAAFLAEVNPDSVKEEGVPDLDSALARAKALMEEDTAPVDFYRVCMANVILAINEVARTLQVAALLLTARLNHLVDFLDNTELPSAEPAPVRDRFARTFLKVGISETTAESLKLAAEVGLAEVVKELAKPLTFGLSVVIGIGQKVREKRKALDEQQKHFDEQRKLVEELREAKSGPGASGYMWMLAERFHESLDEIIDLLALIGDCTKRLRAGLVVTLGPTDHQLPRNRSRYDRPSGS